MYGKLSYCTTIASWIFDSHIPISVSIEPSHNTTTTARLTNLPWPQSPSPHHPIYNLLFFFVYWLWRATSSLFRQRFCPLHHLVLFPFLIEAFLGGSLNPSNQNSLQKTSWPLNMHPCIIFEHALLVLLFRYFFIHSYLQYDVFFCIGVFNNFN